MEVVVVDVLAAAGDVKKPLSGFGCCMIIAKGAARLTLNPVESFSKIYARENLYMMHLYRVSTHLR